MKGFRPVLATVAFCLLQSCGGEFVEKIKQSSDKNAAKEVLEGTWTLDISYGPTSATEQTEAPRSFLLNVEDDQWVTIESSLSNHPILIRSFSIEGQGPLDVRNRNDSLLLGGSDVIFKIFHPDFNRCELLLPSASGGYHLVGTYFKNEVIR